MKQKFLLIGLLICLGCGSTDLAPFSSLTDKQPIVLSVTPVDGEKSYAGNVVEVQFSRPIDLQTLNSKSLFVTSVPEGEVDLKALSRQASIGKADVMKGSYEISEDGLQVRFVSETPFPPVVRCGVVVTPHVLSSDHLPVNQTPGKDPTPFFSSFYAVDVPSQENNKAEDKGKTSAITPAPLPQLSRPNILQLNEVFYDAVGSDTEGNVFIELWGESQKDIADYQIIMVNGKDGHIVDTLKIPKGMKTNGEGFFVIADAITGKPGVSKVLGADWIINFDPPNGPDSIQLVDPNGDLVDVVGYGSPLVLTGENSLLLFEGAPALDAPSGQSISRFPGAQNTHDNLKDWVINKIPTPGSAGIN